MPAVIDVRPRSSQSAVAHVVRWSGWAVVAVSGGRILFFPAVPPVAMGFFLALLLVAPFIPFERAIARVKAGDPERPAVIPLVYAFHTSGVAVLLYIDDAGPTAGICTTMALLVATYGAIGRRAHLMLAVASVLLVPLLWGTRAWAPLPQLDILALVLAPLTAAYWIVEYAQHRRARGAGAPP
jgi:hypothetical protein